MAKTWADMAEAERAAFLANLSVGMAARAAREAEALDGRRNSAWALAQGAAQRLRREFGASRVAVFGSLARGDFTRWSDVDVAAWGVPLERRWAAMADLSIERDRPGDLSMDVVVFEDMPPPVRDCIEGEAVDVP